jgi:branched-chain amino acid transport system permease protein
MNELLGPFVNAILLGGLYAVIAVGMSMIFGIVKLVNLAHGDLMILGCYLSLTMSTYFGIHPLTSIIIVAPIMFLVGFALQSLLFNRVLGREMEPPLLVAFGLSIIIQNLLLAVYTPDARSLTTTLSVTSLPLGENISVSMLYVINFLVGLLVIGGLQVFFRYTYMGRAIRGASDDSLAAALVGVNTRNIYALAMGIAMITAAVSGVLVGMTFTFYPHTGATYLIIAFGVVIIGGLGSIKGTLVGGIILAMAQLMGAHFLGPGYQLLAGYAVLLVVLALRPEGIFKAG